MLPLIRFSPQQLLQYIDNYISYKLRQTEKTKEVAKDKLADYKEARAAKKAGRAGAAVTRETVQNDP